MNIKNLVIGIAIIILTISAVIYGVHTFYKAPQYEDFCGFNERYPILLEKEKDQVCPSVCVPYYSVSGNDCVFNECGSGCLNYQQYGIFETLEDCKKSLTCWEDYEFYRERYSRNIFLIALPLGIIILIIGAILFRLESVGSGLMGGGVGVLLWGVLGYWRYGSDLLRFGFSLVGLAAVIYLAYWFNKKDKK